MSPIRQRGDESPTAIHLYLGNGTEPRGLYARAMSQNG